MEQLSKSVKDLLKEAIKLEINGKAFFNHAAEITHNQLGKKMFQRLAEEEVKHLETFSRLFNSITKSDTWKNDLTKQELEGRSAVIEELSSRMKRAEGKSEIEALSIGMELERKAIDFFRSCSEGTDDPMAKEIFEKIVSEEKLHYDLLQAQYDSVTRSGFWLDTSEFRMDSKY